MGNININGRMSRKSVVRDTSGNIINLLDEADGGWIIRNRQVVNHEKYQKMLDVERDRKEAALAITKTVESPHAEERTVAPSKVDALEKKVESMENKLDAILKALNK